MGSASSSKPCSGAVVVFFNQVTPSIKYGAKLGSNDSVYCRLCRQASNDVIVSRLVRDHCLGARLLAISLINNPLIHKRLTYGEIRR